VSAALIGATAAGVRVFLGRMAPIAQDEMPCIKVRPGRAPKEAMGARIDKAVLTVEVSIHTPGDPWLDAADAVAVAAHRCLMADPQLAALAPQGIRNVGSEWDDHESSQPSGCLTLEYEFRYTVSASDLTTSTIL
jgi:hypothetical protein